MKYKAHTQGLPVLTAHSLEFTVYQECVANVHSLLTLLLIIAPFAPFSMILSLLVGQNY